jgi:glycosyltransferase involved in cell wall biosynthesis
MSNELDTISVVICVYTEDRWADILAAVSSCERQTKPPDEIIIVVDYNPVLLSRLAKQFPNHTITANSEQKGLSGARNTGIAAATSSIVAFLDDDATASDNWIELLAGHCAAANVLGAGSGVDPLWVGRRPRWFPEEFLWVVGCSYRGMPLTTSSVRNPMGGAMCVRRAIFDEVGDFYSRLGRGPAHRLASCEETEFCIRARKAFRGHKFVFEPAASIRHKVSADRVTWNYFRSRCYAEGISKALVVAMSGTRDGLSTERVYTLKILPRGIARGMRDAFVDADPSGFLRSLAIMFGLACTAIGYAFGTLQCRFGTLGRPKIEAKRRPLGKTMASSMGDR